MRLIVPFCLWQVYACGPITIFINTPFHSQMYLGLDNKLHGHLSLTKITVGQCIVSIGEHQDHSHLLKEIFSEQADLSWLRQNTGASNSGAMVLKSVFQSSPERKGEAMGPLTQWVEKKKIGWWQKDINSWTVNLNYVFSLHLQIKIDWKTNPSSTFL